jgi:hypothetical protein
MVALFHLPALWLVFRSCSYYLESNLPVKLYIFREVYLAHATASNQTQQLIMPQFESFESHFPS